MSDRTKNKSEAFWEGKRPSVDGAPFLIHWRTATRRTRLHVFGGMRDKMPFAYKNTPKDIRPRKIHIGPLKNQNVNHRIPDNVKLRLLHRAAKTRIFLNIGHPRLARVPRNDFLRSGKSPSILDFWVCKPSIENVH